MCRVHTPVFGWSGTVTTNAVQEAACRIEEAKLKIPGIRDDVRTITLHKKGPDTVELATVGVRNNHMRARDNLD
jgi:hypothetical protein